MGITVTIKRSKLRGGNHKYGVAHRVRAVSCWSPLALAQVWAEAGV